MYFCVNYSNYHTTPEPNFPQQFLVNMAQKKSNFGQKNLTSQKNLEILYKIKNTNMSLLFILYEPILGRFGPLK
jgi:hypothetical protein